MNKSCSDAILFQFRLEKSDTGPATGRKQVPVPYPIPGILQVESLGHDRTAKIGESLGATKPVLWIKIRISTQIELG
jgi:hypothetical protein